MGKGALLITAALALVVCGKANADDAASDQVVIASVESLNIQDLGRPFTSDFLPVTGKEARSVFPQARTPRRSAVNEWRSDFIEVTSLDTLRANASAWGLAEGSLGNSSDMRYLVFRVRSVEYVQELDDTTAPREVDPTTGAVYYLRKIYYGRMYEIVFSGTQDVLNTKTEAMIPTLAAKFGLDGMSSRLKVSVTQKAKGLKPNGTSLFARTVDEIKAAYKSADMGPPVPILAEYRRLPGTKPQPDTPIDWTPPATTSTNQIKVRVFFVPGNRADWTDADLTLDNDDALFGAAEGKVKFSDWSDPAEADAKGDGGLAIQIGTRETAAGKAWASAGNTGVVQLRVRDSKYTDNSGGYAVTLIVVPKSMLAAGECKKQAPDGTFESCN